MCVCGGGGDGGGGGVCVCVCVCFIHDPFHAHLQSLEIRYGAGSSKMAAATQLVKDTITEATKKLVALYDEKILVQALVLEWEYP